MAEYERNQIFRSMLGGEKYYFVPKARILEGNVRKVVGPKHDITEEMKHAVQLSVAEVQPRLVLDVRRPRVHLWASEVLPSRASAVETVRLVEGITGVGGNMPNDRKKTSSRIESKLVLEYLEGRKTGRIWVETKVDGVHVNSAMIFSNKTELAEMVYRGELRLGDHGTVRPWFEYGVVKEEGSTDGT